MPHDYTSYADLGGRTGFGPVVPEDESVRFHEAWEPAVLGLVLAMGATGSWNLDMTRAARETLPDYLRLSYYHVWLAALERLLLAQGKVQPDELAAGRMLHPPLPVARVLRAPEVDAVLAAGTPTQRPASQPPRFRVGDRVRTRAQPVPHHTRLPGYVRGKCGTIERLHGTHVFADANAQGLGEQPQPLYTVVFEGTELWGRDATPGLRVSVDAWEPYLDAA